MLSGQVIGLDGTPRVYNEKSDLWACGILLFVMLSGTIPFYCDGKQTPLCMDCRACTVSILRGGVSVYARPSLRARWARCRAEQRECVSIHEGLPIFYPFHVLLASYASGGGFCA